MLRRAAILSLFLSGCVSTPRGCDPLFPQRKDAHLYKGQCKKLIYHDTDYSADCRGEMLVFDPAEKTRSAYFFTNQPHELIVFTGAPFSVDPESLRFDVHRSGRAPRSLVGTELNLGPEKGACDFITRDPKSLVVKCTVKSEKGKTSTVEFVTKERHAVWCAEDFPVPERL